MSNLQITDTKEIYMTIASSSLKDSGTFISINGVRMIRPDPKDPAKSLVRYNDGSNCNSLIQLPSHDIIKAICMGKLNTNHCVVIVATVDSDGIVTLDTM